MESCPPPPGLGLFGLLLLFACVFRMCLGPGSGSIGFGTQFYAKLTYQELGSSHERLIQTDVHVKIRDETSQT